MDKNSSELAALFIIDNFDKISGPMKCWNIMMDISPQNVSKWSFKTNTDGYCFYVATYQLLKLLNNGDEGSFWKEQSVIDNSDIIDHVKQLVEANKSSTHSELHERATGTFNNILNKKRFNNKSNWGADSMVDIYFGHLKPKIKLLSFSKDIVKNRYETFTTTLSKGINNLKSMRESLKETSNQKFFIAFKDAHFFIIESNNKLNEDEIIRKWASSVKYVSGITKAEEDAMDEMISILDEKILNLHEPVIDLLDDQDDSEVLPVVSDDEDEGDAKVGDVNVKEKVI